jgi:hypothetical protein
MALFRRGSPLVYVACSLAFLFMLYELIPRSPIPESANVPTKVDFYNSIEFSGSWNASRDSHNLRLDNKQCSEAFPGLFADIDRAVADRKGRRITLEELEKVPKINGYVRGMIYNQELSVIDKQGGIYSRELATLSALYRAIITSPEELPNIEFTFISDDKIAPIATWAYARRHEDRLVWLIPDFGFWAWPETKVGSYNMMQQKAVVLEDGDEPSGRLPLPFRAKLDRLVWRGATMGLPLREKFIAKSQGHTWSDVKEIHWHDDESMRDDLLSMEDHCKYKFVAHTEGNSYSGRLKYLQNCRSVLVAHTMEWIQHYQHLMLGSGPQQNYVEVRRDFSDLDETMTRLLSDTDEANRIADNNVRTFREQYLTPAAQACYWRRLIHKWASMSFEPQRWDANGHWRGVPFEDYVLERRLEWNPY